jgi:hypothetical protein
MRAWTVHLRKGDEPLLIPEGFSFGALALGPVWLALHGAWIPAGLSLAGWVLIVVMADPLTAAVLIYALSVLLGLFGQDLRRWSVERRGYLLSHVVMARTDAEALGRLLAHRPELLSRFEPSMAKA